MSLSGENQLGSSSDDFERGDSVDTDGEVRQTEPGEDQTEAEEFFLAESEEYFNVKTWKEDLVLLVDGKKLYVNGGVLAVASPVLTSIVESALNNKGHNKMIKIPCQNHSDFLEFLRCLYPSIMKEVSLDNVHTVLPLACQYRVGFLVQKCEQTLLKIVDEKTSPFDLCRYLTQAKRHGLKKLQEACFKAIDIVSPDDFGAAANKYPLALDLQVTIQNRRVSKLTEQVLTLSEQLKISNKRSTALEHMLKTFWVGDRETELPESGVGRIGLIIPDIDNFTPYKSEHIHVNGKIFHIEVNQRLVNCTNVLTFCLGTKPPVGLIETPFRVLTKIRVLNHMKDRSHIYVRGEYYFSDDVKLVEIANMKLPVILNDRNGFIKDGNLHCEVFLLVF